MFRWSWLGLLVCCATPAWAARPCAAARQARREAHPAAVVVPFAVPVAVPVAVVQQPLIWYRAAAPLAAPAVEGTLLPESWPRTEAAVPPDEAQELRLAAEELLRSRCAECHSQAAARGALALFDEAGALRQKLPRSAILAAVTPAADGHARMPPGGRAPLDAEQLELLQHWAEPPRDLEY